MKTSVAAIWILAYAAAVAIALRFSIGFPSSVVPYLALLVCCSVVGGYGVVLTNVTRSVFREHPIQVTLYAAILSSILLTLATISILTIAALPGFISFEGDPTGWAVIYVLGGLSLLLPATFVSSLISIPCSHALNQTRTEHDGRLKGLQP